MHVCMNEKNGLGCLLTNVKGKRKKVTVGSHRKIYSQIPSIKEIIHSLEIYFVYVELHCLERVIVFFLGGGGWDQTKVFLPVHQVAKEYMAKSNELVLQYIVFQSSNPSKIWCPRVLKSLY